MSLNNIVKGAKKAYDKVNKAASENPAARTGMSLGASGASAAYSNKKANENKKKG